MKIQASIVIVSASVTGNDMESQLGITVDRKWNEGEERGELSDKVKMRAKIIEKNSGISISSKLEKTSSLDEHANSLMEQLLSSRDVLKKLSFESEVRAFFTIFSEESPPTFFDKAFIKFLGEINASLDIDLYYFD